MSLDIVRLKYAEGERQGMNNVRCRTDVLAGESLDVIPGSNVAQGLSAVLRPDVDLFGVDLFLSRS